MQNVFCLLIYYIGASASLHRHISVYSIVIHWPQGSAMLKATFRNTEVICMVLWACRIDICCECMPNYPQNVTIYPLNRSEKGALIHTKQGRA